MNPSDAAPTTPAEEIIDRAVRAMEQDAICWLPTNIGDPKAIAAGIRRSLAGRNIYMHALPPDWEYVVIDMDRLGDWTDWIETHAETRAQMRKDSADKIPALPAGIFPESASGDGDMEEEW